MRLDSGISRTDFTIRLQNQLISAGLERFSDILKTHIYIILLTIISNIQKENLVYQNWDVHQFIDYSLIPLDPWLLCYIIGQDG